MDDERLVRHRVVVGREAIGVVPAAPAHLVGRFVEDVEDVRRLAVAHFDADRIDEHQLRQPMAARRSHLGSEPAAEGEAEQRQPLARQRIEQGEMEMHQVVDRVEILRPRRVTEPGSRRGDDFDMPPQKIEKRRFGVDGIEAV